MEENTALEWRQRSNVPVVDARKRKRVKSYGTKWWSAAGPAASAERSWSIRSCASHIIVKEKEWGRRCHWASSLGWNEHETLRCQNPGLEAPWLVTRWQSWAINGHIRRMSRGLRKRFVYVCMSLLPSAQMWAWKLGSRQVFEIDWMKFLRYGTLQGWKRCVFYRHQALVWWSFYQDIHLDVTRSSSLPALPLLSINSGGSIKFLYTHAPSVSSSGKKGNRDLDLLPPLPSRRQKSHNLDNKLVPNRLRTGSLLSMPFNYYLNRATGG